MQEEKLMATLEDNDGAVRKLLVPAAVSAAGAGVGLLLTRKRNSSLRDSLPGLDGVGDLAEDLGAKLGSLLGKGDTTTGGTTGKNGGSTQPSRAAVGNVSPSELEKRRREREQHRARRRTKS
jgi:hypothetical protein